MFFFGHSFAIFQRQNYFFWFFQKVIFWDLKKNFKKKFFVKKIFLLKRLFVAFLLAQKTC